jgi:transcriptional regulator with XRE-family HTH domain
MGKLGDMIAARRKEKAMSVRGLISGMRSGLSPAYMSKIELHDEIPTARTLKAIARVLDLDESVLMAQAVEEKNQRMLKDLKRKYPINEPKV